MSTAESTSDSSPEDFDPDRILFHGHGIVVVDKPCGIPSHRGTGHDAGIAELVEQWVSLNPGILDVRPGTTIHPVNRLDLEASGVLVLSHKKSATRSAKEAFTERSIKKSYLAIVAGPVDAEGRLKGSVRTKLRGQYRRLKAELTYRRLRHDERMSLVEVSPEGGKTHQIRMLFAENGCPLAGDLRYGRPKPARQFLEKFGVEHLLLHAWKLEMPENAIGHALTFEAPLPEPFGRVCEQKGWAALEQDDAGAWVAQG
jgi:23S rRNA pseudouridine955/2504/2580 synthase